jgi:NAD(P)-dependent dehydrogenase (short-subunit alcohol dehydrogenase family)
VYVPDFTGRVALITGAARGIGLAIAAEIIRHGGSVCITARGEDGLGAALKELGTDTAGRVLTSSGKVDDEDHQRATVEQVMDRWGRLDYLVNNVGINPWYGPLMEIDLGVVRKVMEANVVATIAWTQLAWHAWLEHNGGAVLNISSIGGLRTGAPVGAYNVSKAAVIHLTRQLALEMAPNVRVNAIAPAMVRTEFSRKIWDGREEALAKRYPLGRLGTPDDVGRAAAFLLSDDASWITGETLTIDGGVLTKS